MKGIYIKKPKYPCVCVCLSVFLDAELKEGDLEKAVKKWRDLRSCRRKRGGDKKDFLDRFECLYLELKADLSCSGNHACGSKIRTSRL